jgi:ligand-binding sensor domain-containing protein
LLRYRLHILLLLLCYHSSHGQQPRHYAFTHYGSSAGVASNEVYSVSQDEQGYIWVGTSNGLQRYDGARFKTFRHDKNNPATIPSNVVFQVLRDKKDNLWLLTASDEIGIFDKKTFTYRKVPLKTTDESWVKKPRGFVLDEYGNIMVLIAHFELLTYNEKKNEFSPAHNFIKTPPGWDLTGLFQQPGTKKYWIAAIQGMAVFNSETNKLSYAGNNSENEAIINDLGYIKNLAGFSMDKSDRLWLHVWEGSPILYAYNMKTREKVLDHYSFWPIMKAYHETSTMLIQRDGTIWITGLGLFARYLEKEKQFELVHNGIENEQSIAYTRVHDLYEDKEGNVWVPTSDNGLFRFTPSAQFFTNVRPLNRMNGKPANGSIMSFTRTKQGNILAGAWGDGLYQFDTAFNMIPLNIKGLGEKATPSMWDICASADGKTLWIGAQPGIYRVDQDTRESKFYNPAILKERTIRQIAEDRYGNLWIGTQSLGLFKWSKEKGQNKFEDGLSLFAGIPTTQILNINTDKNGYLWISAANWGVYVINPANDKVLMHFGTNEKADYRLLSDASAAVIEYDDSTVVIAANGLHFYDTKKQKVIRTISLPESIPGNMAAMEKDRQGYLWVSMTSGIFRVNPKNEIFIHFDRVDGIANDHFIIAASYTLPDGRILFGADNQVVLFDPLKVKINDPSPDVTITGFRLMNKSLRVDSLLAKKTIQLNHENNSIVVEFSGLSFNGTYIIRYKMQGLDKEWQRADNTYQAVYTYLPPGTYTFLAQTEDAEGNPSGNIEKFTIIIYPPFWKTWWFFCLLTLFIAAVFYWLDTQRVNKLVALQNVRTEIAGNLHEEVNSTLNNINLLSEMARIKADKDVDRSKEYIDQISVKSHNMIMAMDDILWSIDPQNDTMEKSLLRMMEFADSLKNKYGCSIEIALDKRVRSLKPDMKTRHEVFFLFKEALKTIVEYAGGKETIIHIDLFKNKLSLKLHDSTATIDNHEAEMDASIKEMNSRAGMIGAELDMQYDKKGIAILLFVPMK